MKYKLIDYEINGYDDSDFLMIYWDSETNEVSQVTYDSTRYGSPGPGKSAIDGMEAPTPEIIEKARQWLANHIFKLIKMAEVEDIMEPGHEKIVGQEIRALKNAHRRAKYKFKKGDVVTVLSTHFFGQFYRSGYNKPNRYNCRLRVKTESGEVVFVNLKDFRRNQEPKSDKWLRNRAEWLSYEYQFGKAFPKFAWATRVFGENYYKKRPENLVYDLAA